MVFNTYLGPDVGLLLAWSSELSNSIQVFFFDDQNNIIQRQTPKANTMIEFDSRMLHASSNPTQGERYVLNTVMSDSLLGLD